MVEQYNYYAFGKPEIRGGPVLGNPRGEDRRSSLVGNRFVFTGREWAHDFGFYEYRNRAYNPDLGRFMSEDPKGFAAGDRNLFRYCGGDPVNRVDPMGLDYIKHIDPADPKHVIFEIPIVWRSGKNSQAQKDFVRGIESRWTQAYPDNRYTTRVTDGNKAPVEKRNYVRIYKGVGVSTVSGGRIGDWYERDAVYSRESIGGHEGGHMLGRPDGYVKTPGPFPTMVLENGKPKPKEGYDADNIMVNPDGKPDRRDFEAIEHGDGKGLRGYLRRQRDAATLDAALLDAALWLLFGGTGGQPGEGTHVVTPNKN